MISELHSAILDDVFKKGQIPNNIVGWILYELNPILSCHFNIAILPCLNIKNSHKFPKPKLFAIFVYNILEDNHLWPTTTLGVRVRVLFLYIWHTNTEEPTGEHYSIHSSVEYQLQQSNRYMYAWMSEWLIVTDYSVCQWSSSMQACVAFNVDVDVDVHELRSSSTYFIPLRL